jgi:3-dehydroquinate dehydratase-2
MAEKGGKKGETIGVASGVNLDLLGKRETAIYGSLTLGEIETCLQADLETLQQKQKSKYRLEFFQTNVESEFLAFISRPFAGLIINPGAWTHTSLALADRLRATGVPFIETHLSNVAAREPFRHHSYCAPHAAGVIYGLGLESYRAALYAMVLKLSNPSK